MSLFPLMLREMRAFSSPLRRLERQMRLSDDFFQSFAYPSAIRVERSGNYADDEKIVQDNEKFQVQLNVKDFNPQDITIKATDNLVEVQAKYEEKNDEIGYLARQLVRSFTVPKGHEIKNMVSTLSSDGILTITAPKKPEAIKEEKSIPITFTIGQK